jgi:hypothetical protein
MVLGIVGLPLVLLSPVPMYLALFCLIIPIACVFICLWTGGVVCAIVGLCLSVAGKRKALETNSGEMMAITGVALSCITLGVMAIEIIFIMFIARLAG